MAAGTVGDWRRGTSRTTGKPITPNPLLGLACAALAAGLKPWVPRRTPVGLGLKAPPK